MGGQAANQAVDPAIQQITEFINTSVNDGQDPTDVVMSLMEQEVDQQIIAQAFMQLGYQEEDVVALFQQVQEKSQPAPPSTPEEQTRNPQEITRNETMAEESQEGEMPMAEEGFELSKRDTRRMSKGKPVNMLNYPTKYNQPHDSHVYSVNTLKTTDGTDGYSSDNSKTTVIDNVFPDGTSNTQYLGRLNGKYYSYNTDDGFARLNGEKIPINTKLNESIASGAGYKMPIGESGIEIKPENEGKFTKWATARGMSVQEAASKVMSNTDKYPPSVVKMANFAKNAAGWEKEEGGETAYLANRDRVIKKEIAKAQSGSMKEGGEFEPHFMYKGERKIRAKDMATHLRLKDAGYMPEAQTGQEIQRQNRPTFAPNYVNPLAFESGTDFSLGKAATVLGSGYNAMFAGDKNEDGTKDGSFRDWSRKRKENQLNKGNYYDYEIKIDPNDPNSYAGDKLDLFNASKGKDGLRTLQQYTDDVNENSYANYNAETGKYDTFKSSRESEAYDYRDRFGTRKRSLLDGNKSIENAREGENLNYFNSVDDATRQEILDFGNASKAGMPEGTTLSIDPVTGETSYMDPKTDNPNQYNTMMGYNKSGATGVNTPAVFNPIVPPTLPAQSMIPTNQNGQVFPGLQNSQKPGPRADNPPSFKDDNPPSFKEWQIQNAIKLQSTPLSEQHSLYNNTTFEYGGDLPKAQFGPPTGPGSCGSGEVWDFMQQKCVPANNNPSATNNSNLTTTPGQLTANLIANQSNPNTTFNQIANMGNTNISNTNVNNQQASYEDPTVKRTNKFQGGLDRFMDSNAIKAYGDVSEFAVNAADVVNDFYNDRNVNQARVDNYNQFAVADNIYGTYEDPFNKRGLWDVNKGTAGSEGDRTTGLYLSKEGGEINVDSNLLAKLIAAGADIEIL